MSWITKIFGDPNAKVVASIRLVVDEINALEPRMVALSDEELKAQTTRLRGLIADGATLDEVLPEAFATVREAAKRVVGMRHFDVQLIGGIALHRGNIAEMRTGEGKTLVATLPAYLNALAGAGVHVVTVNDYLAKRDAVWMSKIYDALGLSVGIIQQLGASYRYTSKKMKVSAQGGPVSGGESEKEEKDTSSKLKVESEKTDEETEIAGVFQVENEFLEPCSRRESYACDITYGTNNEFGFDYLRDNMAQNESEMVQRGFAYAIVDEVDSILIDEARTPLIISAPAEEATDQYYRFADLVARLSEKTDYNVDEKMRAATLTEEGIKKMEDWLGIANIYAEGGMLTVHHIEQALRAAVLFKRDRDYVVDKGTVVIVDEFTGRKMQGRRYSEGLHQAIEAKERVPIQRESRTMATVTFQNFFRLYKKLSGMTGTAVTEAEEFGKIYHLEVITVPTHRANCREDLPDRIYATEEAKFNAIVEHVRALQAAGQPVLIGTISVEKNEELSEHLERAGITHEILNAKNHEREGEIIAQAGRPGAVTLATNMAGRGVDIILGGNPPDLELKEQARTAGGLFVIGTERHESRRIDNQLRGRSARQGDPGKTQFYLSTEDDLMRIFAGDRIRSVMKTLRVPEDMPIEHRAITKLIESAQKKVEGFHFDSRKHLLEYDDVLNRHREVIYGRRRVILDAFEREKAVLLGVSAPTGEEGVKTLRQMVYAMISAEIEQVVSFHTSAAAQSEWNVSEIQEVITTIFPLSAEEKEHILQFVAVSGNKEDEVTVRTALVTHLEQLAQQKYESFLVQRVNDAGIMLEIEKQIMLRAIDNLWVEHLVAIDHLRTGIGLRGYGQRDPLVEYKKETYRMFHELLSLIQKEVVYSIFKVGVGVETAPSVMQPKQLTMRGAAKVSGEKEGVEVVPSSGRENGETKVGRNDMCPCGSGKKFKKCHGT